MVVMFPGRVGEHSESAICTAGKPVWRLRHVRKQFFVRVCMYCEFCGTVSIMCLKRLYRCLKEALWHAGKVFLVWLWKQCQCRAMFILLIISIFLKMPKTRVFAGGMALA